MKFSGLFLIISFGIVFNGIMCFPELRSNDRLIGLERKIDDLRSDLNGELNEKRNVIAILTESLLRHVGHDANEPIRQNIHAILNTGSLYRRRYLSIDLTSTHDTVNDFAIHFRNRTAKLKDDLLMELQQLGDFKHQGLISDSKEKGNEFRKSIIQVKTILQNVNASIDNFTSQVSDYISRFQSDMRSLQKDCNTLEKKIEQPYKPTSCQDVKESGVHSVYPDFKPSGLKIYCEIDRDKAWSVIQRRKDGTVDFDRSWEECKTGFGDVSGELWLENEYIYQLTKIKPRQLRIDMRTFDGKIRYAFYNHFGVTSEAGKYRQSVDGFIGDIGDQLKNQNGHMFSTYDEDNTNHGSCCACSYHAGWWFSNINCHTANLNVKYYYKHESVPNYSGVHWSDLTGANESLKTVEIKIH